MRRPEPVRTDATDERFARYLRDEEQLQIRHFALKLSPKTLRELAAAMERQSPEAKARSQLSDEGLERLADILLAGRRPTVGFWLRYRKPAP